MDVVILKTSVPERAQKDDGWVLPDKNRIFCADGEVLPRIQAKVHFVHEMFASFRRVRVVAP
jgi:hypothetical protein